MSSTHPLPHHPSTPLPVGEVVYLISGKLDRNKTYSIYSTYGNIMGKEEILNTFIADIEVEAVAKRKSTGELIKVSTYLLGYIESDVHYSEAQAVMQSVPIRGYNIRWEQTKNTSQYHHIFEDEESVVPLKDLVILDGIELYNEIQNELSKR